MDSKKGTSEGYIGAESCKRDCCTAAEIKV